MYEMTTNLKEVILHNYRMLQHEEDREECMVHVELQFGEINHDTIYILKHQDDEDEEEDEEQEGQFAPLNIEQKDPEDFWVGGDSIEFHLEFDEVEDFIEEIKAQLDMMNYTGCKLITK